MHRLLLKQQKSSEISQITKKKHKTVKWSAIILNLLFRLKIRTRSYQQLI